MYRISIYKVHPIHDNLYYLQKRNFFLFWGCEKMSYDKQDLLDYIRNKNTIKSYEYLDKTGKTIENSKGAVNVY